MTHFIVLIERSSCQSRLRSLKTRGHGSVSHHLSIVVPPFYKPPQHGIFFICFTYHAPFPNHAAPQMQDTRILPSVHKHSSSLSLRIQPQCQYSVSPHSGHSHPSLRGQSPGEPLQESVEGRSETLEHNLGYCYSHNYHVLVMDGKPVMQCYLWVD